MTEHGIVCKLDGSTKSPGDCYFGACSNKQYFECYPDKYAGNEIVKQMKEFTPRKNKR